jgi:hypothetical protein
MIIIISTQGRLNLIIRPRLSVFYCWVYKTHWVYMIHILPSLVPSDSTERDRTVRYISFEPSDVWRLSILYGETKNKYSFHPHFIYKKAVKALDSALNQAHQITSLL